MPQVFSKYVPWHKRIVNASRQQRRQEIEVKYHAADDKLRLLENELDALIHFVMSSLVIPVDYNPFHISQSKILRQEQMEVMQNVVTYSDATPSTRTVIPDANERLGHYLQLQERRNLVDQAVTNITRESECIRSECSWLWTQLAYRSDPTASRKPGWLINWQAMDAFGKLSIWDAFGLMKYEDYAQIARKRTDSARETGILVGTFGAAAAYASLSSSTRGSLGLTALAFAFFAAQVLFNISPPSNSAITPPANSRIGPSSKFENLQTYFLSLLLPRSAFLFLALSIFGIQASSQDTVTTRGLGYFKLAALLIAVVSFFWSWRYFLSLAKWDGNLPSHLSASDGTWSSRPGGDSYGGYQNRRSRVPPDSQ